MRKITSLSISTLSKLALAISANASITVYAAEQLETVIVTANKIETDIQQTALSIESLSGAQLSQAGASNLSEIAKLTPGLQMDETNGGISATVRIRGIGTPGYSALDPSVPIFIDGIAQGRNGAGFQDLLDIARVEILRGPQGTLYGRNSTAGAINVWTKNANTHQWEGSLQAQIGNYDDRELRGTVNIPIVDNLLAARVSAFSVKQDGYVTNGLSGKTGNGYADRYGGRAKVAITPADNLSIQWATDYSKSINHPMTAMVKPPQLYTDYAAGGIASQPGLTSLPADDEYNGKVYHNVDQWTLDTNFATSVSLNWDIQDGWLAGNTLTSITAYQLYKNELLFDQDLTILDWETSSGKASTDSWSQELRLSNGTNEHLEYVSGLYFYGDRVGSDQLQADGVDANAASQRGLPLGGLPHHAATHDWFNTQDAAIFGQVTYHFTQKFSLTAGLRESWVQKSGNSHLTVLPFNLSEDIVDHETLIETDTSGVLKARYFLDDNTMLYASYDRGFKPGGFNRIIVLQGNPATSYHKEVSNNYEVGAKTQWFENRLQANIAAFYMEFQGYHNQVTDQFQNVVVENLASVTTEGVEADAQGLLAPGLTLGAGAAYLNPRVRSDDSINLTKGQLINDVSQYSANLNGEFSHQLFADQPAVGFVRIDWLYRSPYTIGNFSLNEKQDGYSLSNIHAGLRNIDNHWSISAYMNNVFDKEYAISASPTLAYATDGLAINQGAPRTYGMAVQYDY